MDALKKISEIRSKVIIGETIDLHPYSVEFIDDIIRLRNQSEAKYFLNQNFNLTREQQLAWMEKYMLTENEAGFVIKDKKGYSIGLMFLYDYKAESNTIEIGRLVFDLQKTKGGPYFLEGMLTLLDLAFDCIRVDKVVAIIKKDNLQTLKYTRRIGFKEVGESIIRNEVYVNIELASDDKEYKNHFKLIEAWKHKV